MNMAMNVADSTDIDLCKYWFDHPEVWFCSTPKNDKIITNMFGHLLEESPNIEIKFLSNREILEYIILYDQVIRHVYRADKNKITKYSKYSLELSLYILDNGLDNRYLPEERCFILMPLRHTFDIQLLEKVLSKIKEYRKTDDSKYYKRFYKATILSLSKLKSALIVPEPIDYSISETEIYKNLDGDCLKNLDVIMDIDRSDRIYRAFMVTLDRLGNYIGAGRKMDEITISLSGGVDSMISSFILYHISNKQTRFKIIAVTIDYGNREDNEYEIEFVKRWCKLLEITHYVRHITELKRNRSHDRDIYEQITRNIRFDMYRRFNNPVILGHNLNDCLENIFNNIKKTRSLGNMRGMSEFSNEEGCIIVRPMLDISKSEIKSFAKKYMIPHLPNSTPSWSERGRIRDELIPLIDKFDGSLLNGFIKLADNMKGMYDIYNNTIVQNFVNSIEYDTDKVTIRFTVENKYGFLFWKDIITHVLKKMGFPPPSNKSIRSFEKRIYNNQYGKIKISNNVVFIYASNKLIFNNT